MNPEKHRLITTYTQRNGNAFAGIPEFSAVTTLDDQQIYYNDSNIKKLIPRQDWMKEFTSEELKEYIKISEEQQQIYKNNIHVLKETFNESQGVHTYQRMYGCVWDDETGDSQGFDQFGYDGEDFISLDLKENRYITPERQGVLTVEKWNNDREQLTSLKRYYDYDCVYWLKEFLHLSKATSKKTDPPKVSLLQKNPDYYTCHVTGFHLRDTSISWRENGQAMNDSSNLVESGDTLPNEDGTFQRRVTLYVLPDERKKNNYTCVVEHKSLTEPIQKNMTEGQIMRNRPGSDASYITNHVPVIIGVIAALIGLIGLIGLFGLRKHLRKPWKKLKDYCQKKTEPAQESAPSQDSLIPIPSNESLS